MIGIKTVMHIYNIRYSPMIIASAIKNNVERVILVHTTGIYLKFKYVSEGYRNVEKNIANLTEDPTCPTQIIILRPTMIYGDLCDGNISKFIKIVDKYRFIPVINGGQSLIQPVNARNLGKNFLQCLCCP